MTQSATHPLSRTKLKGKIRIIGMGGTAQYLLAALMNYDGLHITIQDKDQFDDSNLSRQWMSRIAPHVLTFSKHEELNKVRTASEIWPEVKTISRWYNGEEFGTRVDVLDDGEEADYPDVVIACVDNHPTRNQLKDVCRRLQIPLILPGNLDDYGQCYTYHATLTDEEYFPFIDPWEIDPTLANHIGEHPVEAEREDGCDSGLILVDTPQIALANMTAAVMAARHLVNLLTVVSPLNWLVFSGFSNAGFVTTKVRQIIAKKKQLAPTP